VILQLYSGPGLCFGRRSQTVFQLMLASARLQPEAISNPVYTGNGQKLGYRGCTLVMRLGDQREMLGVDATN